MRNLTNIEFIERAVNIHGDEYDYSLVNYVNSRVNVNIVCKKHGIFSQNPRNHVEKKSKCPLCRNEKLSKYFASNTNNFIKKAIKIHNNKYDYSLVNYINGNTKIMIICSIHGIFHQRPQNHLNGAGCSGCKESIGEKKITNFLGEHNIHFERQVSFKELIGDSNLLFYDFYLPDHKMMIEYDGIQHSKPVKFFGGEIKFLKQKEYDLKKIKYAINNGYRLLKLTYNTLNYLEEALWCELKNESVL